jgi:hypothetical protein
MVGNGLGEHFLNVGTGPGDGLRYRKQLYIQGANP